VPTASRAGLPATKLFEVADTVVVRPDRSRNGVTRKRPEGAPALRPSLIELGGEELRSRRASHRRADSSA
jgi:hypothetical protein